MSEVDPLKINLDEKEDRYSRLRLIPWWDQELLRKTKVLVVGAGALGNEILKNLALVGVGRILVLDMDRVENSNLSRSVLFRAGDEGRPKAGAAAAMVQELNPDCRVRWLEKNAVYELGLGVYRWADLVIGGLDNREARLAINQACWKVGTPWIDGAIEVFFGTVRVFVPPATACYECTMNELDYKLLNMRKSCTLLSRDDMIKGKVPTTPTIASIIAGIQVQEALKLIHRHENLPTLAGKGYFFNGVNFDSYEVIYDRREECPSHNSFEEIGELPLSVKTATLGDLFAALKKKCGPRMVIDLERDLLLNLDCGRCKTSEPVFKPVEAVSGKDALCPICGEERDFEVTQEIGGKENFLKRTLEEVGIPPLEIITGRNGLFMRHFELIGDRKSFLGKLA